MNPLPNDDRTPIQKAEDLADLHISSMKMARQIEADTHAMYATVKELSADLLRAWTGRVVAAARSGVLK